ncbi:MAG TPA: RsmE family RNA methyltransferase [Chitinophagaceae bacterium]|nr:RsmE family RNA methyltransferase [Chitinophagaceae bacterium]
MPLPFFYEEDIKPGSSSFVLSEETSKHCVQVLRMKTGEQLELTDGLGNIITAAITAADKRACVVRADKERKAEKPARQIAIGISLLKNPGRFEWFLEKAVETGVSEIYPLLCARTERQHFRHDRMKSIVVAAMLQSQQAWLPMLHNPVTVDTITATAAYKQKLIAHCADGHKQKIAQLALQESIIALIGPEGDFTPQEIDQCLINGYIPVTLGNTRLRTETAGITALVLLVNN